MGIICSCGVSETKYRIGMSQCAGGEWRDQMNNEVMREVLLHDDISLDLCTSYDNWEQQSRDIDSLVRIPVDLLIISPTDPIKLKPAIESAHDKGIPIILVDRDIKSDRFTSFIGGDNKLIGRTAAQYVANLYQQHLRQDATHRPVIVEVEGATDITPTKDRHTGFMQEMNRLGLPFASTVCNWHQHLAAAVVDSLVENNLLPAIAFAHSDNMAVGMLDRLSDLGKLGMVDIVSVDGSPQLGMKLVSEGNIKATMTYPTGGSEAIRTAIDILHGRHVERVQFIKPVVVDVNNVQNLLEQENRAVQMTNDILQLGERLSEYTKRSDWQASMIIAMTFLIACLTIALILVVRKHRANSELQQEVLQSIQPQTSPFTDEDNPSASPLEIGEPGHSSAFITNLREVISQNIENPNFSVDDMGETLGMGRTQFFRKTKTITGYTPNDLLRTMRLQRAAKLLRTTDLNISDISHRAGFNNPSYFTRAFRDQYKMTPKEYRGGA